MTAKRTRSPAPSNNAAEAFDELRNQVSLLHAAIEGLTAAKDKLPDYSPTPRKIEARLEHAAGLKFCRQSRPVRRILLRACVVGLGVASYQALLPAIVRDVLGGDELDYGFCLAAFGMWRKLTFARWRLSRALLAQSPVWNLTVSNRPKHVPATLYNRDRWASVSAV